MDEEGWFIEESGMGILQHSDSTCDGGRVWYWPFVSAFALLSEARRGMLSDSDASFESGESENCPLSRSLALYSNIPASSPCDSTGILVGVLIGRDSVCGNDSTILTDLTVFSSAPSLGLRMDFIACTFRSILGSMLRGLVVFLATGCELL